MGLNNVLVTIGILTYRRTDLLIETLRDICKTNKFIELIIVNNNENLDIYNDISFIENNKKIELLYIWDKKNYGVANGRNKIIENLKTDYLIIFDDDIVIPDIDKIIDNCVRNFNNDENIGGIAFHIKDNNTKIANRYEIPHKNKYINLEADFFTYLFIGAGHAIRKSVIDKIGGYPIDFGLYGSEEIDLAFRIIGNGYKIRFISDNVIFHKKSPSGRHDNLYVYYLAYINRTKISIRYFKLRYVLSCILIRGLYLVYQTKNFKYTMSAFREFKYEFKNRKKSNLFNSEFYSYIKSVKGFLWW